MDWQPIFAGIISASGFSAVVGAVLKKTFERSIDHRFEELKEHYKQHLQEALRRQAQIYDASRGHEGGSFRGVSDAQCRAEAVGVRP